MTLRTLTAVIAAALMLATPALAKQRNVDAPAWWLHTSGWYCIHTHESTDWAWGPSHHPRQPKWNQYYGGFQFTKGTWDSTNEILHRNDDPERSSPGVQRLHAFAEWTANGHRWGGRQWPTSSAECGLP